MNDKVKLYQSNALTEGRYQFDLIEKRIIYFIIDEVRRNYVEQKAGQRDIFNDLIIRLPGEKLRRADPNMKRVYESARKLRKKDIEINNEDEWLNVGFINYAKHIKGTDTMEIGVSSQILPYIVQLTKNFHSYYLAVAITLKSTYTQRFYELCSKWRQTRHFYKNLDQLKRILKCEDRYKNFGEFKRGVLEKASKELKELYDQGMCDLFFEYKIMKKEGKKVTMLGFYITTIEDKDKPAFKLEDYQFFLKAELQSFFPRDPKFVERVMKACANDYEMIKSICGKIAEKKPTYKKEMPAVTRYILREDFDIV